MRATSGRQYDMLSRLENAAYFAISNGTEVEIISTIVLVFNSGPSRRDRQCQNSHRSEAQIDI